jgi:hypothetical protein
MSYTPLFWGTVSKGRVILDSKDSYIDYLSGMEGKRVGVAIHKERKSRSDQQNRYYWGVVCKILGDHLGYTPDEMHDIYREKFLKIPGEEGRPDRIGSTASLSTAEFETYQEQVRMWASQEFGVYIPLPNEVFY